MVSQPVPPGMAILVLGHGPRLTLVNSAAGRASHGRHAGRDGSAQRRCSLRAQAGRYAVANTTVGNRRNNSFAAVSASGGA